jgi:hypothetical protein
MHHEAALVCCKVFCCMLIKLIDTVPKEETTAI